MQTSTDHVARAQEYMQGVNKAIAQAKSWSFDTVATRGIYTTEEALANNQGSLIEPVYLTSAQSFADDKEMLAAVEYKIPRWVYSRISNPSLYYLEATLGLLESYGCEFVASACTTSSGMAAIVAAIEPLLVRKEQEWNAPFNFVSSSHVYGGTFQQFSVRQKEKGCQVRWAAPWANISEWEEKIDTHTRFVYIEVPSNPNVTLCDIKALATLCDQYDIPLIVDATLATPALFRPLAWGADIVIHSLSKSMTASGLSIGGALLSRPNIRGYYLSDEVKNDYATYVKLEPHRDNGSCISPLQAIITLSEVRSLRSRTWQMSSSALKVAAFLESHAGVEKVLYPGLKSHPQYGLAEELMQLVDSDEPSHGGLLSFCVKGGHLSACETLNRLGVVSRALDLGRVKSVANIPAISTHQQQGDAGRELASIPNNLIRLSIGLENPQDIINDLEQALS
ncbi:Methionine gamma-lyase [Piscirickettsia salmonis]|uniref:Aminotransferase class-V family protein n=1 Tax=Piscirickettsia salmonis TaxID=1238 RepID=A0A1L6T9X2_PISSA|nr:aminotransferase class I/II-fold pyridoxal phosphate-dependent enzyme [Piscirickettsia salmonis]AKP73300.1 aminotransferase class-V family protein [Piscirickettsia salmonis LF-89 = ATCC VR-1361]ALB22003.1 aminotransferase class-V family protein [Piscirickettsia salmonis]ALY02148.1 aminotransferase class-V family protein [Piscirickettsia salmonis]AMA41662.1 aminotransferase class-V family protein [Piscirickettsia salmonis]AOS34144.1 aminotransferase class-V family protein [Piscirickettsia sa